MEELASQPRILIVNDEVVVLRALSRLLSLRYLVETAASGEDALAWLEREPFDLLLTDGSMPGMHGVELLEWVRERRLVPHAGLMTAVVDPAVDARVASLGLPEPLHLPVDRDGLYAYVELAMRHVDGDER